MQKHEALRAYLTQANPELARNPDALRMFVDQGRVVARGGAGMSFEYRYRLNILIVDYVGHEDAIFFPLVMWLADNERAALQNFERGAEAIQFEADILDNGAVDLSIEIELTEAVDAVPRAGGGHDLVHRPEPAQVGSELLAAIGDMPPPPLRQIWIGNDLVLDMSDDR